MKYIELSAKELESNCQKLTDTIMSKYIPDLIIYIAKGGFPLGKIVHEATKAELVGIDAVRTGNRVKELAEPILKYIPKFVLNFVRKAELKSGLHNRKSERNVKFHPYLENINLKIIKKILVVDDSVDSGYSVKAVVNAVSNKFPNAQIKVAAINVWEKSFGIVKTDYYIYKNTFIRTPMSKDSREYKAFKKIYAEETNNGYI